MKHMRPPAPPTPPPTRIVIDDDYTRSREINEANYRRYELKLQCFMLIDEDRRMGLNLRSFHEH